MYIRERGGGGGEPFHHRSKRNNKETRILQIFGANKTKTFLVHFRMQTFFSIKMFNICDFDTKCSSPAGQREGGGRMEGGKQRNHFSFFFRIRENVRGLRLLFFVSSSCSGAHTEMGTLFIISRVCMREEDTGGQGGQ